MHIAVCDDNVADRKQLERLLKRESDKRAASTGIIYTDSFGNSTSLLSNPMQYDAFYIDMCLTEGITGTEVANALIAQGVNCLLYTSDAAHRHVLFQDQLQSTVLSGKCYFSGQAHQSSGTGTEH